MLYIIEVNAPAASSLRANGPLSCVGCPCGSSPGPGSGWTG
ncbi:hypothetical protein HMPREF1249_0989 [Jonquetella sp. BV3C21]|nr:hypothetical protein GCWU000246_01162 [Jonquetella anthropi E3_33 E1]ERL23594.1 hypothetical protein HMPREF1249_0989 [Jonquetella sp. BV3C21]